MSTMQTATGTFTFVASVSTRSARVLAAVRRSIVLSFLAGDRSGSRLPAMELAEMEAEPILDIAWRLETPGGECLDSFLCGRTPKRGDAGVPAGAQLHVRWQARVDQ